MAHIIGTAGDDSGVNALHGTTDDDLIEGFQGRDELFGDDGSDELDGGEDADKMYGGKGNDIYHVDNAGDLVVELAGEGSDTVFASRAYTLTANVEKLVLTGTGNYQGNGNALNNSIIGNDGSNRLNGGDGNDTIGGGLGDDTLDGGKGIDTLNGGVGNDRYFLDKAADIVVEYTNHGTDTVYINGTYTLGLNVENLTMTGSGDRFGTGNALDNMLTGNAGDNTLGGADGNDVIDGGKGMDSMRGGMGNDTFYVDNTGDTVAEYSGQGTDSVFSTVSFTLSNNVENLTLSGTANVNATGNGLDNTLTGNGGNNVLNGKAGDDTMTGGLGNDTYYVDTAGDVVVEAATSGRDTVVASLSYTLGANLENLTLTGLADLNGTGNSLANTLIGNAGNNDLNGAAGADTMTGGMGNDTYHVDNAGDAVHENAGEGVDAVMSSVNYALTANVENLTLTGTANINATGTVISSVGFILDSNVENLTLTGTSNINATGNNLDNLLTGNDGRNILDGKAGADTMAGGLGNDTYFVDNIGDIVTEAHGAGTDTVYASISYTLTANVENLVLTGTTLSGVGNNSVNTLTGNSENNTLDGKGGADTMIGHAGDDTYAVDNTGDTVIEAAGEGIDTVRSNVDYTLADNVENLILTSPGTGYGNALDNVMTGLAPDYMRHPTITFHGGDGNDTLTGNADCNLYGDAGDDVLTAAYSDHSLNGSWLDGGAGAAIMTGGTANDFYIVDNLLDVVNDNSTSDKDLVMSSVSYVLGTNLENLTLTGTGNINGTGNSGDNILIGNAGDNILTGGGGSDTVSYKVSTVHGVHVDLGAGTATGADIGTDTLIGISTVIGSDGDDVLIGSSGSDHLVGSYGNNVLDGGLGADRMDLGGGNDTVYIDNTGDDISHSTAGGTDILYVSIDYGATTTWSEIHLTGSADLSLRGSESADHLFGNDGNNLLDGEGGTDILTGGKGADTFVYDARHTGAAEKITDFSMADNDQIWITGYYGSPFPTDPVIAQSGSDVTISFPDGRTIIVQNIQYTPDFNSHVTISR